MIDDNNNAILLLNARFSSAGNEQVSPLTPSEWGRFAGWLRSQGKRPADLLSNDREALLAGWDDKRLTVERIGQLLERGNAMALALEKWSRAGIWVITRSDADYPRLLKHHLGAIAPAVLYGCGNKQLLSQPAIGVVGSREVDTADSEYASALGRNISLQGYTVASGCAKGVDSLAMLGALDNDGTVIGVVADSLLQAARARKWRDGLMSNNLVLVSPYYPDAAFSRGNAMGRNKFIYCLSQATLVVHSGKDGGTWTGAEENLKKGWVPLWVKRTAHKQAGNVALVQMGGHWLPDDPLEVDIRTLIAVTPRKEASSSLFDDTGNLAEADPPASISESVMQATPVKADTRESGRTTQAEPLSVMDRTAESAHGSTEQAVDIEGNDSSETTANSQATAPNEATQAPEAIEGLEVPQSFDAAAIDFYEFFIMKLAAYNGSFTTDSLAEKWQLPKKMVKDWLETAEKQGQVFKLTKPIRFVFNASHQSKAASDKAIG